MSKKKRNTILAVSFAVIAAIVAYIVYIQRDIPPPDVSDLMIGYQRIPDDENAFVPLNKAASLFDAIRHSHRLFAEAVEQDKYDAMEMRKFMGLAESILQLVDEGLARDGLQFPKIQSYDTLLPYLSTFRSFGRMQLNRALYLFKSGREKEAFDVLADTAKFGWMMQNGDGGIINYLVGTSVEECAHTRFREHLTHTSLDKGCLKPYIDRLDQYRDSSEVLENTFKVEFRLANKAVDDVRDGKITVYELCNGISPRTSWVRAPTSYSFKPNKTRKMLADTYRIHIDNMSKPYAEYVDFEIPDDALHVRRYRIMFGPNWAGKRLYHATIPGFKRLAEFRIRNNLETSITRLLIALKCYTINHGSLPESLDQLVPEYINEIPADGYDGNPIRYSKEKRILYSVGPDLKDDGGPAEAKWVSITFRPYRIRWQFDDPAVRIGF